MLFKAAIACKQKVAGPVCKSNVGILTDPRWRSEGTSCAFQRCPIKCVFGKEEIGEGTDTPRGLCNVYEIARLDQIYLTHTELLRGLLRVHTFRCDRCGKHTLCGICAIPRCVDVQTFAGAGHL